MKTLVVVVGLPIVLGMMFFFFSGGSLFGVHEGVLPLSISGKILSTSSSASFKKNESSPTTTRPSSGLQPKVPHSGDPRASISETSKNPMEDSSNNLSRLDCQRIQENSEFFVDITSQASRVQHQLELDNNDQAEVLRSISCLPQAVWFGGGSPDQIYARIQSAVTRAQEVHKIIVVVLYNVPQHTDLRWGSGISGPDSYRTWITAVSKALGSARVWLLLEPDSISLSFNYSPEDRAERLQEIQGAVSILKHYAPHTRVYLDGGHSSWHPFDEQAKSLLEAGIEDADGFFTNVSNYQPLSNELLYGKKISAITNGKHFIIDTSRNGIGPSASGWCNPHGVALGKWPTRDTGDALVDALFWIKPPGESDGTCNGGPSPGKFWVNYALQLIENAI